MHRDAVAERQILAMAMTSDQRTAEKFRRLPIEAFSLARHRVTAGAITRVMTESPGPLDVHRVARLVAERTSSADAAETAQRFVHDLNLTAPPLSSWDYYADQVLDAMHVRGLVEAGHRLVQLGESAAKGAALEDVAKKAREAVDAVADRTGLGVSGPPISLQELLDQEDEPHNWLVPGLLEHMDRLMLTGFEGLGKSYLLAQLALCIAAGVHPFSGRVLSETGHRVLVLDCENSKPQIRRRYRKTAAVVNRLREKHGARPADWSTMIRLEINPDGIDLGDARTRSRIEDAIAATAPDLVIGGPLYKLHRANLNEETAARDLVGVLDDWRGRYGTALILEAHSGYAGEQQGGRKLRRPDRACSCGGLSSGSESSRSWTTTTTARPSSTPARCSCPRGAARGTCATGPACCRTPSTNSRGPRPIPSTARTTAWASSASLCRPSPTGCADHGRDRPTSKNGSTAVTVALTDPVERRTSHHRQETPP